MADPYWRNCVNENIGKYQKYIAFRYASRLHNGNKCNENGNNRVHNVPGSKLRKRNPVAFRLPRGVHACPMDTGSLTDAQLCNSAKMAVFAHFNIMNRDHMLMEAILGKLVEAPEPLLSAAGVALRLNTDASVVLHHLQLLGDKGWVTEAESGFWRLTNAGHDYLDGNPLQGISLKSLG